MPPPKRVVHSRFARALRAVRRARGLSQEEFDVVSGRTYISALERGLQSPTITKVDSLASLLKVHPLTLLSLAYATPHGKTETDGLLQRVREEVAELVQAGLK